MTLEMTIVQLPDQDDPKNTYNTKIEWFSNHFNLLILFKEKSWKGEMKEEDIKKFSSRINQTEEEYLNSAKDALQKKSDGYFYSIKDNKFSWKKLVEEEQMKVILGTVQLEEVPYITSLENLLNSTLNINNIYQKELNILQDKCPRLQKELLKAEDKIQELIKQKLEMEERLYSKFINLLNAKKEKIRELEAEESEELNEEESSENLKRKIIKALSDSEDDENF